MVTYTGTTHGVPDVDPGHEATLTVGAMLPMGTQASPSTQTVIGDTTFTFTEDISGDEKTAQATASLVWTDGVTHEWTALATFTVGCTPPAANPPAANPPAANPPAANPPAEAEANPLPTAAAAGEANTSAQLVVGGFAAFAAFLMLGAGFVLRRPAVK